MSLCLVRYSAGLLVDYHAGEGKTAYPKSIVIYKMGHCLALEKYIKAARLGRRGTRPPPSQVGSYCPTSSSASAGWATVSARYQSPRSTQPGHPFAGRRSVYQPKHRTGCRESVKPLQYHAVFYQFLILFIGAREGMRERTKYIDIFLFFPSITQCVLFPMFCLPVEGECQILVF